MLVRIHKKDDNLSLMSQEKTVEQLKEEDRLKTSALYEFSKNQQKAKDQQQINYDKRKNKIEYDDGSTYQGEIFKNKKHGEGVLTNAEGETYEGEFVNDIINGYGVFKGNDGTAYKGNWKNGMQHGKGKEMWTDGSYYEGEYFKGLKHGIGFYEWTDGSSYEGEWFKGDTNGHVG